MLPHNPVMRSVSILTFENFKSEYQHLRMSKVMKKKSIRVSNALMLTKFKYIFRIMKLTTLFGVVCVSSAFAANVNSQTMRVRIEANQEQIETVLKQIEAQTDYLFVYNNKKVNLDNAVSITAEDITVAGSAESNIFGD